jgi:hypothetical protein
LPKVGDSWELEPACILDLGDRVLNLGLFRARGRESGVQLEQEYAAIGNGAGRARDRDEGWFRWEEGLRAAGLDPDAIALPKRGKAEQEAGSSSYG